MKRSMMGFLIVVLLIFTAACGTRVSNSSSGTGVPTPAPTAGPGASGTPAPPTGTNPFEVILTSQYETGGPVTTEVDCQMGPGTTSGTINTCNVTIPEGRLHFSTLNWKVNVGPQDQSPACEIVVFQPYYYQAANTAAFLPSWEAAAIDCSTSPLNVGCFSGPATTIVPGFPNFRSVYFLTQQTTTTTYTAKSANLNLRVSDRWAVNNLALASRGAAIAFTDGDAYLGGGNYVDYSFVCYDRFMQPVYTYTMEIDKINVIGVLNDPTSTLTNQYPDWDPTSWDQ